MSVKRIPRVRLLGRATMSVPSGVCQCPGESVRVIFWGDRWTVDCPWCGRSILNEAKDSVIHDITK